MHLKWSGVEAAKKATGESIGTAYRRRDGHRRGDVTGELMAT